MVAVLLSFVECLDYRLYQITNNYMFYIAVIVILLDFFLIRKINTGGMSLLFFSVFYFIAINISQGGIAIGIRYAIIFVSIYLFERIEFTPNFWKLGIYMGVLFFLRYFLRAENYLTEFERQSNFYGGVNYVNIINVNVPCFMVFVCLIFLILYCKIKKIPREKLITLIGTILSVLMSYRLDCRVTIYTSILVYICMEIIPISFFYIRNRVLLMVTLLFLVGCIFPFIVVIYSSSNASEIFTGRELIWSNYMSILSGNPESIFLGLGTNYRTAVSLSGLTMHNSFLEMAFNFGFIGVFLYWLTAFKTIKAAFDKGITENQCYLIIAYMVMLVFGYINTAIQREYLFIFFSMFLGLSNNQLYGRRNRENKFEIEK